MKSHSVLAIALGVLLALVAVPFVKGFFGTKGRITT